MYGFSNRYIGISHVFFLSVELFKEDMSHLFINDRAELLIKPFMDF
jgi:hypothetical protein